MPNLDLNLLKRLVRVGVGCAGFTDAQKTEIIRTAEFGAEGIHFDTKLGIFAGLEALARAPGVEPAVFDVCTDHLTFLVPRLGAKSHFVSTQHS